MSYCVHILPSHLRFGLPTSRTASAGLAATKCRTSSNTLDFQHAPFPKLSLTRPAVADSHALLLQKGKQTFLKPLLGESLLDPSLCWKDGVALRPGVSYVLASGSSIAFGGSWVHGPNVGRQLLTCSC